MLDNFFRINMPYGLKRQGGDKWIVFNREYVPLGWNSTVAKRSIHDPKAYGDLPIRTQYQGLTEKILLQVCHDPEGGIQRDDGGLITMVFLYSDRSNPTNDGKQWQQYFEKIKLLGTLRALDEVIEG